MQNGLIKLSDLLFVDENATLDKGVYPLEDSGFSVMVLEKSVKVGNRYLYLANTPTIRDLKTIDEIILMGRESIANEIKRALGI